MNLTRSAISLGLIERPLTVGIIFSILKGSFYPYLPISIFFELLWLDSFPVGTYIPPNATFATILSLAAISLFHPTTSEIYLILTIGIAAGYISSYLEGKHRILQNRIYDQLLSKIKKQYPYNMTITIYRSLFELFLLGFTLFMVGIYFIHYLITIFSPILPTKASLQVTMLWSLSLTGSILALRIKNSYIVLTATFLTMGIILLIWQ